MEVGAALEHLLEDAEKLVVACNEAFFSSVEHLRERDRWEVLHLDRVPLALRRHSPHPVDVYDARMRQLPDERRAFSQFLIPLALCLWNLHRDDGSVREALRAPHPSVGAVSQALDELVPV